MDPFPFRPGDRPDLAGFTPGTLEFVHERGSTGLMSSIFNKYWHGFEGETPKTMEGRMSYRRIGFPVVQMLPCCFPISSFFLKVHGKEY